jgi:histidinol-phosphate/aromatic aminotransferase/cobyric acid decarboxylase-like protein/choline kinase
MKAIILAAGSGNRMRPFTLTTHKTLLKIGDRTLLDRIIDSLVENSVTEIIVVTGYQEKEVKEHLVCEHPSLKFTFVNNPRYAETNNICSLALAFEEIPIDDDIVLIESDLVVESSIFSRLFASPHSNVALVDRYGTGMDGTVVTVIDGVIRNVIPPHQQESDFNFSDKYKTLNIYKFSKDFCNGVFKNLLTYYAKVIDSQCYYEVILGIIIAMQREDIHAEILDGERWAELDDPNDFGSGNYIFDPSSRYSTVSTAQGGYWNYDLLDFCFLRNMHFPTGGVISELRNSLPSLIHNYGSSQKTLNRKLSYHLLCQEDRVVLLNGAAQVYPILKQYLAGKKAIVPSPTFGEYSRVFPDADHYFDEVGINTDDVVDYPGDVVVFVNPNNPTGTTLESDWIYKFAAGNPDKFVIVDESFIDFSDQVSLLALFEEAPLQNVVVIKSMSKTLGVPGIRLGYTYSSNQEFNSFLLDNLPVWNANSIAEHFLEVILKHRDTISISFQKTAEDRAYFSRKLSELPMVKKAFHSGADFVLVQLGCDRLMSSKLVEDLLIKESIYVKDVSNRFQDGNTYWRLAVRTQIDSDRLVDAMLALL